MMVLGESIVEDAAVARLKSKGWFAPHGPTIAPGAPETERVDNGDVVLERRVRSALARLNPSLPGDALEGALRRLTRPWDQGDRG